MIAIRIAQCEQPSPLDQSGADSDSKALMGCSGWVSERSTFCASKCMLRGGQTHLQLVIGRTLAVRCVRLDGSQLRWHRFLVAASAHLHLLRVLSAHVLGGTPIVS